MLFAGRSPSFRLPPPDLASPLLRLCPGIPRPSHHHLLSELRACFLIYSLALRRPLLHLGRTCLHDLSSPPGGRLRGDRLAAPSRFPPGGHLRGHGLSLFLLLSLPM